MIISESTQNLFSALIRARTDIETLVKDKAGYGYTYATLDNVINMLKGVLPKHDLGYVQFPETVDGKDGVTTLVIHKSGEYMSARYEMDATPIKGTNLTQQKGASITYCRRYALCSVFGIPTEEDTDGVAQGQINTADSKPSVDDIINGMSKMTLANLKACYARAIEIYPKGSDEYRAWVAAWVAKKDELEAAQNKAEIDADAKFVNNI